MTSKPKQMKNYSRKAPKELIIILCDEFNNKASQTIITIIKIQML